MSQPCWNGLMAVISAILRRWWRSRFLIVGNTLIGLKSPDRREMWVLHAWSSGIKVFWPNLSDIIIYKSLGFNIIAYIHINLINEPKIISYLMLSVNQINCVQQSHCVNDKQLINRNCNSYDNSYFHMKCNIENFVIDD